jgi:hypothetical protein
MGHSRKKNLPDQLKAYIHWVIKSFFNIQS